MGKLYQLHHSVSSNKITTEDIWNLWSDVNNWTSWDKGLEECQLTGDFVVGATFSLRPLGGKDLTTTIIEAIPHQKFVDKTEMPFGTIQVTHEILSADEGLTVKHSIDADIHPEKIELFEKTLWGKWQKGLPNSVENIVRMAEEKKNTPSFAI